MKAMVLRQTGPMRRDADLLVFTDLPRPRPRSGELLVRILTCGVCHTELDEIEGRLVPRKLPVVPGHEIVGVIDSICGDSAGHRVGDRVGVGWIHSSDGSSSENLSPEFEATGRDVDGGYAEFVVVPARYAFRIPPVFTDAQAAPLLCAGAIGHRALKLANIRNGQPLGFTGFGGSAHLMLQEARHRYPDSPVYVFARDPESRAFALRLGAVWAGETAERSPVLLRAIIDTTPAWTPVVEAFANLEPGGRLVVNAIRKEAGDQEVLLRLSYHDDLWMERELKTVANITADDIREFLEIAAEIPIEPEVATFPLSEANRALRELKFESVRGAKVLRIAHR